MGKIIFQGAEATIIRVGNKIEKTRDKKSYRLPILDEKLRKQRTRKEAKILNKIHSLIPSPKLINVNENKTIVQEFINGKKLSDNLDSLKNGSAICIKIGENTAKLHDNNIIHNDLTTSNMILKENKVYFIDFGLSFESNKIEDKAVDLHLIKQALEAKHFKNYEKFWQNILKGYKKSKNYSEVIKRLETVERRGRYKQAY